MFTLVPFVWYLTVPTSIKVLCSTLVTKQNLLCTWSICCLYQEFCCHTLVGGYCLAICKNHTLCLRGLRLETQTIGCGGSHIVLTGTCINQGLHLASLQVQCDVLTATSWACRFIHFFKATSIFLSDSGSGRVELPSSKFFEGISTCSTSSANLRDCFGFLPLPLLLNLGLLEPNWWAWDDLHSLAQWPG